MSLAEALLVEWDQEMAATRPLLERVPADKFDWKPHEKSYTLKQLAGHVARLPSWTAMTLNAPELDVDPPGGADWPEPVIENTQDLVALFDQGIAEARAVIAGTADEIFGEKWAFKKGGETIWQAPKAGVMRRFVLNHFIHHRGQLTVYLRLLDVPLPQIFGPTADAPGF